jgi:hypothetical protein
MKTACITNSVFFKLKEREHFEELYVDVKYYNAFEWDRMEGWT